MADDRRRLSFARDRLGVVGGTPTWGGVGTIAGGAIGALTVSFIQSGIVAAGLSGFYVQFFNGLIIILALLGHRWNQKRYRLGAARRIGLQLGNLGGVETTSPRRPIAGFFANLLQKEDRSTRRRTALD